jgi:hypothetical protein
MCIIIPTNKLIRDKYHGYSSMSSCHLCQGLLYQGTFGMLIQFNNFCWNSLFLKQGLATIAIATGRLAINDNLCHQQMKKTMGKFLLHESNIYTCHKKPTLPTKLCVATTCSSKKVFIESNTATSSPTNVPNVQHFHSR